MYLRRQTIRATSLGKPDSSEPPPSTPPKSTTAHNGHTFHPRFTSPKGSSSKLEPTHSKLKRPSKIPRSSRNAKMQQQKPNNNLDNILAMLKNVVTQDQMAHQQQTVTLRQSCSIFSDNGRLVKTQSKTVRVNVTPSPQVLQSSLIVETTKPKVRQKSGAGLSLSRFIGKVGLRRAISTPTFDADRRRAAEPNIIPLRSNIYKQISLCMEKDEVTTAVAAASSDVKSFRPDTVTLSNVSKMLVCGLIFCLFD